MQRNFDNALKLVLKHEGGFVNHPSDPGGATNKGITIGTYRRYINRKGTIANLRKLTVEQAGKVYRAQYWDKIQGDNLPNGVDYITFDFAVNSGPSRSAKHLQKVVGVTQDGQIGLDTLTACRRMSSHKIIARVCANRLVFLKRLKHWKTFGKGWETRVTGVEISAYEMANEQPIAQPLTAKPEPKPETASEPVQLVALERKDSKPVMVVILIGMALLLAYLKWGM